MKQFLLSLWEVAEVVLVAVVTVFLIRTFLIQPFLVSGASMEPNFSSGDYLIIDEISYHLRNPQRNETIVFKYPNDPSVFYIKRVIGLPGERVVVRDGKVFIYNQQNPDGFELTESYLDPGVQTVGAVDLTLDAGKYFVLGDNRGRSYDSRSWGLLPQDNIIGLVRLRLLPLTEAKAFTY